MANKYIYLHPAKDGVVDPDTNLIPVANVNYLIDNSNNFVKVPVVKNGNVFEGNYTFKGNLKVAGDITVVGGHKIETKSVEAPNNEIGKDINGNVATNLADIVLFDFSDQIALTGKPVYCGVIDRKVSGDGEEVDAYELQNRGVSHVHQLPNGKLTLGQLIDHFGFALRERHQHRSVYDFFSKFLNENADFNSSRYPNRNVLDYIYPVVKLNKTIKEINPNYTNFTVTNEDDPFYGVHFNSYMDYRHALWGNHYNDNEETYKEPYPDAWDKDISLPVPTQIYSPNTFPWHLSLTNERFGAVPDKQYAIFKICETEASKVAQNDYLEVFDGQVQEIIETYISDVDNATDYVLFDFGGKAPFLLSIAHYSCYLVFDSEVDVIKEISGPSGKTLEQEIQEKIASGEYTQEQAAIVREQNKKHFYTHDGYCYHDNPNYRLRKRPVILQVSLSLNSKPSVRQAIIDNKIPSAGLKGEGEFFDTEYMKKYLNNNETGYYSYLNLKYRKIK